MKVGIIGSGVVAQTLGSGLLKHSHQVMLGTRTASKLTDWKQQNPSALIGTFTDVAAFGDLIILAAKGEAAVEALREAGVTNLNGKTIIDATNPIDDAPPTNGVLRFFTNPNESLMETLQSKFPQANFVKAFNSVGAPCMVNPQYKEGKPTMFICGRDERAKAQVKTILDQFGWETADMGGPESARAIEPLCILWCIPGFLHNQWTHAFKLLR
jgi:8-hydroxy-5-deazaflavin:NADPH oxidoreductase